MHKKVVGICEVLAFCIFLNFSNILCECVNFLNAPENNRTDFSYTSKLNYKPIFKMLNYCNKGNKNKSMRKLQNKNITSCFH